MCRWRCVLSLVALYVGLAHSWDIAVGVGDQLIFYTNAIKTTTVDLISQNLTALAYDEVHNMMLYVNKQSGYDAICGYAILSMENKCYIKRHGSNIQGIAFDPVSETLFFTDAKDKSINWISLKPTSINSTAQILLKMDDRTPKDIAVDSCGGYIYWSHNYIQNKVSCMERARLNGSEREKLYRKFDVFRIFSLTVDPQIQKIYYVEGTNVPNKKYWETLERADLNGQNEKIIFLNTDSFYAPEELTVSNDYLYWVHSNGSYKIICQLPKKTKEFTDVSKILQIIKISTKKPVAITANYKLKDQIRSLGCEALSRVIPTSRATIASLNTEQTTESISETPVSYAPDNIGNEYDVAVCQNYCLHGTCNSTVRGLPSCRCEAGYTGERCEVNECHGYCLNGGDCSLNGEDEPVCQCDANHEGSRCEATKVVIVLASNNTAHNISRNDFLVKLYITVEV